MITKCNVLQTSQIKENVRFFSYKYSYVLSKCLFQIVYNQTIFSWRCRRQRWRRTRVRGHDAGSDDGSAQRRRQALLQQGLCENAWCVCSSGIIDCMLFRFKNIVLIMRKGAWCGIIYYHNWKASIKQRELTSPCKLLFLRFLPFHCIGNYSYRIKLFCIMKEIWIISRLWLLQLFKWMESLS